MQDLKQYTVLVVDDELELREVILSVVEEAGFDTVSAGSGKEAVKVLGTTKVDLILSDMRMPDGDGLFLLNTVRAKHPTIPIVIFITGYTDVSEEDILSKGATKVFPKPFDSDLLLLEIKNALKIND